MSLPNNTSQDKQTDHASKGPSSPNLEESTEVIPTTLAPLTSRALAAFVDYLVLQALLIPLSSIIESPDNFFLLSCAVSIFYLGIGNSVVTSGRTLGKRAFGLIVVNIETGSSLSITQSCLRCLIQIVFPILLIELPPLYFRNFSIEASPLLLESQMLLVLVFTFWNASLVLAASGQRAGHDFVARSVVLQGRFNTEIKLRLKEFSTKPRAFHLIQTISSIVIGSMLWWLSVSHSPSVDAIHQIQYSLENKFPLRIVSVQAHKSTLNLQLLHLSETKDLPPKELVKGLCQELLTRKVLLAGTEFLEIELLAMFDKSEENSSRIDKFKLSTSSCMIL